MSAIAECSTLCLGTSRLRSANGGVSQTQAVRFLQQCLGAGVTFFDTANIYGQGDAEVALGEAFAEHRDEVVLATKVGYAPPRGAGFARVLKPLIRQATRSAPVRRIAGRARDRLGSAREVGSQSLVEAVHDSLRRLRTDYLDVLYLHSPGPPESCDTAEVLWTALEKGLCRRAGVSVVNHQDAAAWAQTGLPTVVQIPAGLHLSSMMLACRRFDEEITVVGREVMSGGQLLDASWVNEQLLGLAPQQRAEIEPGKPLTYLRWLIDRKLVDHVALGTTNIAHVRMASDQLSR
jgi:aryl-alcohol dehydrogenase-like predicted oxidoreductase